MVLTLLPATAFGAAADYSVSVTGTEDTFPYGATVINNCTAPNGVTCYLYVRVSIDEDFANLSLYGCIQITGTGSPTAVKDQLTRLLPDTKYYYSVQITDKEYYSEGYSVLAESPIITFTTAPAGGVAAADEIKEGSPLNITFAAEKIKYLRFNPTDPQIAKITITGNNAGDVM